jgi:hypothetical protein
MLLFYFLHTRNENTFYTLKFLMMLLAIKNILRSQVPVVHTCNPSYSGGRDQEDGSSKPAQANSSGNPISKNPITKIGLVEWLKLKTLNSNLSTAKTNKQQQKNSSRSSRSSYLPAFQ